MTDDQPRRMRIKRSREFYIIEKRLLRLFGSIIGPNGIALYNALSSYVNSADDDVWPTVRVICAEIGISDSTARRSIETLERLNLVRVYETFTDSGQTSSTYEILDIPKSVPEGWERGPRPVRGVLDLRTDRTNPPPAPAAVRAATPCHTDRPPLSQGQTPPVTVTHQLKRQSRREKKGSFPLSPSSTDQFKNDGATPTPTSGYLAKIGKLRELAASGANGPIPAELALSATDHARLTKWAEGRNPAASKWAHDVLEFLATKEQPR